MGEPRMAKANWQCPGEWSEWSEWLAAGLHARNRWRLPVLLAGILFAHGRRTVTSWLRANGISADYADYFYFLASLGRKTESVATQLFLLLLRTLPLPDRLLAVIDDSPTKRYGPKVEGAAIPKKRGWKFRTKLDLAAQLLEWIVPLVKKAGKTLWVVVDGGYTKVPFLKRAAAAGVVVVGRLRKDAALRTLPPSLRRGQRPGRGRPRKYGKHKISLAKRAGQKRGWRTVDCTIYGKTVTKTFKTFLATYRPAGGVIRVVIVQEEHGWFAFFCTDPTASVVEILEAFADRAAIEVELWAWRRRHGVLCDRRDSPWDDADRRPSHADRRKALRQHIMRTELSTITATWSLPRKIFRLAQRLMALAA